MPLPPVIRIVADESLWDVDSAEELASQMKTSGLEQELRNQAIWSRDQFEFDDHSSIAKPGQLTLAPSGSLNPFSPVAKCASDKCSLQDTHSFITSVGLYSDQIFLPDPITGFFLDDDLPKEGFRRFRHQLLVLRQIMPLVEAGIIRFGAPFTRYCKDCRAKTDEVLDQACASIAHDAVGTLDVRRRIFEGRQHLFVGSSALLYLSDDHKLFNVYELTDAELQRLSDMGIGPDADLSSPEFREFAIPYLNKSVRRDVSSIFLEAEMARRSHAILAAGSRIEPLVIAEIEGQKREQPDIEEWEALRTIHLPWVRDLSVDEVLRLRLDAGLALPRLRDMFASKIAQGEGSETALGSLVAELRDQANEVESELASINVAREKRYQAGLGSLALSFVVYGFASAIPALQAGSFAALLATLAHLRSGERETEAKLQKAISKPGYAVLRARHLLREREARG